MNQSEYDIRCEWGPAGLGACLPGSTVVVIVDVLSFCTAVDIVVSRRGRVHPWADSNSAQDAANKHGALLASLDRSIGYSLSPASLVTFPAGARIVLPSLNGAALSLATAQTITLAGCIRNASAVAIRAQGQGLPVTVIPAGERWSNGSLRPALEDWLGAGAIIHSLHGNRSPEAAAAEAVFLSLRDQISDCLYQCMSGRELVERGFSADVALSAALDASAAAPMLVEGAYEG